jgi:hypothetical protein
MCLLSYLYRQLPRNSEAASLTCCLHGVQRAMGIRQLLVLLLLLACRCV